MALRHVACLRFADEVSPATLGQIAQELRALPEAIPEIERYYVGTDAGIDESNHDLVVVADFADRDAYLAYRDHPVHRRVIEEHIRPILAERAAVQHEH